MKLLIVDDEELTRNGLVSSIDWEQLGITGIRQASDGVFGLEAARSFAPDIILCDVRMPRMDGIAMLEQIESFLPDVAAIFMSGYSDKEYLKAAIKLKAINYIEKPIDPAEIRETITKAVEQCRLRMSAGADSLTENTSGIAQLAYCFTVPYSSCKDTVDALCERFRGSWGADRFQYITTFIVKLVDAPEDPTELARMYGELREYLSHMHLHMICSEKRIHHLVFHIFGQRAPLDSSLTMIAQEMNRIFASCPERCIAIGETVCAPAEAYHSYESAVIALQSSFFFEPGSILPAKSMSELPQVDGSAVREEVSAYLTALNEGNEAGVARALDSLKLQLCHHTGMLPNQLKGIYYDMFTSLYRLRRQNQLHPDFGLENQDNIMDIMDSCFSFFDLHRTLTGKTCTYFEDLKNSSPENSIIYMIREFIAAHYPDPGLSVKTVSEHVKMSASYTCTFFKGETGMTLNQYITDFRMKKASQLLADPRIRISEISSRVGYNDGNYFSKSFRKYAGVSPSEYREQVLT